MGSLYALAVEGYHIFCSHKIKIIVDKMKDIVCGMEVNNKAIKACSKERIITSAQMYSSANSTKTAVSIFISH